MATQYTRATPLDVNDFMERLNPHTGLPFTEAEARHEVAKLVFGADYKVDANGKPIEQGKGSAAQPTQQHFEALAKEAERQAMTGRHLTPEAIGQAVAAALPAGNTLTPEHIAAAVVAAMAAMKPNTSPPRRRGRPPRKPAAAPQPSSENEAA